MSEMKRRLRSYYLLGFARSTVEAGMEYNESEAQQLADDDLEYVWQNCSRNKTYGKLARVARDLTNRLAVQSEG